MIFAYALAVVAFSSLICFGAYVACRFAWDTGEHAGRDWRDFDKEPENYRKIKPDDKMILWWVRWYGSKYIPEFYQKPIYACMTCMASLFSLVPTLIFTFEYLTNPWYFFLAWPMITAATAGLNSWLAFNLRTV